MMTAVQSAAKSMRRNETDLYRASNSCFVVGYNSNF